MSYPPILAVHVCAGSLGLVSGTAAICFRKGSPRHALAGRIFVASMLAMAVGAVYLAILRHQSNNIGGGILTFYLIGTMVDRQAQRSRNEPLRLGCLTDSPRARNSHLDRWR